MSGRHHLRRTRSGVALVLVARGVVTKASLAVRAPSGRPFAFASLSQSGPVRLFVARNCVEDS